MWTRTRIILLFAVVLCALAMVITYSIATPDATLQAPNDSTAQERIDSKRPLPSEGVQLVPTQPDVVSEVSDHKNPPTQDPEVTLVNGHTTEYWDMTHKAVAKPSAEALLIYEAFVEKYPDSVDLPHVLSLVALTHSRLGQHEQAIKSIIEAIDRCEDESFKDILGVNKAHVYTQAGYVEEAIAQLAGIIEQSTKADSPHSIAQTFIAPQQLAEIYVDAEDFEMAHAILDQSIVDGFAQYNENPSAMVASYIEAAYQQTVQISLAQYPGDYDRARTILEELGRLLPVEHQQRHQGMLFRLNTAAQQQSDSAPPQLETQVP